MLNANETLLFMQAAEALRACQCQPAGAHSGAIADLTAALLAAAATRAAMAASAAERPQQARRGPPAKFYPTEASPKWRLRAEGLQQAVDAVNEELTAEGQPTVSIGTVRVTLARSKQWTRMLETDNGMVVLTIGQGAEAAEPPETGTNVASAQSEHETKTNPETREPRRKRQSPT